MIDSAQAPGTIKSTILALRLAVQQERDTAAVVLKEAAKTPDFEGVGSSDPNRGNNIDISV